MSDTPLIKEFIYNVAIDKVWQALTSTDQMKIWYFSQLQKFEPKFGFQFQFEDDNTQYQKEWMVTRVVEGKVLAHNWAYQGYSGNSEVIFKLFSEKEQTTKLQVTQTGLGSFPDHPHFKRERFEWGWDNLLGENLKRLLENNV